MEVPKFCDEEEEKRAYRTNYQHGGENVSETQYTKEDISMNGIHIFQCHLNLASPCLSRHHMLHSYRNTYIHILFPHQKDNTHALAVMFKHRINISLRQIHQTSNKSQKLPNRQIILEGEKVKFIKLTRRGRTSTISSGTKKINAFIFLAIEIASLAKEVCQIT